MGYTTEFWGSINVEPPLNEHEIDYLTRFAGSRRMNRHSGPYTANTEPDGMGQDYDSPDVIDHNTPPIGQPGMWCQWIPSRDGFSIEWDGGEKFYNAPEWMQYIIDHFLRPGARIRTNLWGVKPDPAFEHFTCDHVCNGTIDAQGEEPDDRWRLVVTNNEVTTQYGRVVFS